MAPPAEAGGRDAAAAVLARRSRFVTGFMARYMRRYAARHFHAVRLARHCRPAIDPASPVIVYANHPSWWDPVLFVLLQCHIFGAREGYGPMEARELERYGILSRIGVFGVEKGSRRGADRFLRIGSAILARQKTVLWVTSEGAFTDARVRPVRLRRGVAHLMRRHPEAVALPLALEYPFWNESTPEALARFGTPISGTAGRSIPEWETVLEAGLARTMDLLAEDAIARDPARFDPVIRGGAGIGGVYDAWRRGRALLRGERVRLEHGRAEDAAGEAPPRP